MIKRLLLSIALLSSLLIAVPITTSAFDIFGGVDCSGEADKSAVCNSGTNATNPLTGPNGTIIHVANIVAVVAGMAAVIIIIISGIRFMTSGGNSDKATEARKTLTGALIGLAVIVMARAIIGFVLSRLR